MFITLYTYTHMYIYSHVHLLYICIYIYMNMYIDLLSKQIKNIQKFTHTKNDAIINSKTYICDVNMRMRCAVAQVSRRQVAAGVAAAVVSQVAPSLASS